MWFFFFFKQKTAYEMRISDWSSDVCSSDLDRQAVGAAGLGHRTHRLRLPDAAGNVGIADRGADGDLAEGPPHALLEGGAAQVERQIETEGRRLDEAADLRHPLLELGLAADQLCLGEAVLERAHQHFRLGAQIGRAPSREEVCTYVS